MSAKKHHEDHEDLEAQIQRAMQVKQAYQEYFLAKAHVVGLGVGFRQRQGEWTNIVALVVMVEEKIVEDDLAPEDRIPPEVEGVPVDVQVVGQLSI